MSERQEYTPVDQTAEQRRLAQAVYEEMKERDGGGTAYDAAVIQATTGVAIDEMRGVAKRAMASPQQ